MTKRGWVILGVLAAIFFVLATAGVCTGGYFLYQHMKKARAQEAGTVLRDTTQEQQLKTWKLSSYYDSAKGTTFRWYAVENADGQYDITIFNDGIIQLSRLDTNAPAFACPAASDDTCYVTLMLDNAPAELQLVHITADGGAGAAAFVNPEELLPKLVTSSHASVVFTTQDGGSRSVDFYTSNCPIKLPAEQSSNN